MRFFVEVVVELLKDEWKMLNMTLKVYLQTVFIIFFTKYSLLLCLITRVCLVRALSSSSNPKIWTARCKLFPIASTTHPPVN